MTVHRVADYLDHMLEPARQACLYVEGLNKSDLLEQLQALRDAALAADGANTGAR